MPEMIDVTPEPSRGSAAHLKQVTLETLAVIPGARVISWDLDSSGKSGTITFESGSEISAVTQQRMARMIQAETGAPSARVASRAIKLPGSVRISTRTLTVR